jgi:phage terminase large subunit-like protein
VSYLKNERLKCEAESINQFAAKREIEDLFKTAKDNSTFQKVKTITKCPPVKLKDYFQQYFNPIPPQQEPVELTEFQHFINELQTYQDKLSLTVIHPQYQR